MYPPPAAKRRVGGLQNTFRNAVDRRSPRSGRRYPFEGQLFPSWREGLFWSCPHQVLVIFQHRLFQNQAIDRGQMLTTRGNRFLSEMFNIALRKLKPRQFGPALELLDPTILAD